MTQVEAEAAAIEARAHVGRAPAPWLFAVAVFTSAALVFIVQPMLARMILPRLGGSSMVWNTSLAFFQGALLLGYAYAHMLQRIPSLRRQMIVHFCVLVLAALTLPLRISGLLGDPAVDQPGLWLVGVLAVSVGAPFAALSATAPLIQAWFARLHGGGPNPRDPYVLYAASNLGSLLALLAYPLVVEPFTRLGTQSLGWTVGYGLFALVIVALIALAWRARDQVPAVAAQDAPEEERAAIITWRDRFEWMLIAAAPSSLLLGVTGHISSDIASAPFLWVAPLALYLLTFIIAFASPKGPFVRWALILQAVFVPDALLLYAVPGAPVVLQLPLHLLAFFFTALVCAYALAWRRPPKAQLTEFYMWMSLGGVLGGSFNAFIAPVLFSGVWEYPIVLILAALARPTARIKMSVQEKVWCVAGVLCGLALLIPLDVPREVRAGVMLAPALFAVLLRHRTVALTVVIAVMAFGAYVPLVTRGETESRRSFFGVVQIKQHQVAGIGPVRVMVHGSTIHGAQALDPARRCTPMTYYSPRTPMGEVFTTEGARRPGMSVGVVGLGTGSVAAFSRPGDRMTFFEIDPLIARLAFEPQRFTFVADCAKGPVDLVLGDARVRLEGLPDRVFDLLMIDAFSSDTIPTHLMTAEAVRLYFRLIKPGGVVMLHLSNRNVELGGPAEAAVRQAGGYVLQQRYWSDSPNPYQESSSHVLVAARTAEDLAPYAKSGKWNYAPAQAAAWTDDYVNLAGAIWARLSQQPL